MTETYPLEPGITNRRQSSRIGDQAAPPEYQYSIDRCPLGWLSIVTTPRGLRRVEMGDDRSELKRSVEARFPAAIEGTSPTCPRHQQVISQVLQLLETPHELNPASIPLDLEGTDFQKRVWNEMMNIPLGQTSTYRDLAAAIDRPKAYRAVANACGANPVAIVIPCHRVVRTDGGLGGFHWGIDRKQYLLAQESNQR